MLYRRSKKIYRKKSCLRGIVNTTLVSRHQTSFIHLFKNMTLGEKTRIIFSKLGCHGFSIFKEIFFDEFYRFKIVFIKYIPWRFAISGKRRLTVNILKKLRQICRVSFPCFCHANQGNEHSKQGRGKTSKRCLNKSLIQRVYEISLNTGCNKF